MPAAWDGVRAIERTGFVAYEDAVARCGLLQVRGGSVKILLPWAA